MAYAYARLHDVLPTGEDSDKIKETYYTAAANQGIGDAFAFLAYMYRDGDLGEMDMGAYETLMLKAQQSRSEKARQQLIRNAIYGINGSLRNPARAYELAEEHLKELDFPNPAYYMLMAEADMELGRTGNAICNFRDAAKYGQSAAFYWWATIECCDSNYNIVDEPRFKEIMHRGISVSSADCFLMHALLIDEQSYENLSEEDKAEMSGILLQELKTGWELGDSECTYLLADFYDQFVFTLFKSAQRYCNM